MGNVRRVTSEIAEFVATTGWDQLPREVVERSSDHVLDSFGVMVAGSTERCSEIVRRVTSAPRGPASMVGLPEGTSPAAASLANGVAGHALDFDDTQLSTSPQAVYGLLTHPSVPVLAAVAALGEERGATGAEVLVAFVVGVEVACRVADAINPRHYQAGFHSTGTAGTVGATAGACRILGLDQETVARALGIGASLGAGLRENFGTMTKPLHSGRAAQNGVLAALLAEGGFTASTSVLEADRGFFQAAGGGFRQEKISGMLGRPFFFVSPGVSIKPYPSGSLSHPAQDLVLDLVSEHDVAPNDVVELIVGTNSNVPNALIHHRPTTGLEGKFSMEYCMATGVVRRRASIQDFTDEAVRAPEIQAFLPKVTLVVDPELEALGYQHVRTRLQLRTASGRVLERETEWARGYPQNPLSPERLSAKFLDCAGPVLGSARADEALAALAGLAKVDDIRTVLSVLRTAR